LEEKRKRRQTDLSPGQMGLRALETPRAWFSLRQRGFRGGNDLLYRGLKKGKGQASMRGSVRARSARVDTGIGTSSCGSSRISTKIRQASASEPKCRSVLGFYKSREGGVARKKPTKYNPELRFDFLHIPTRVPSILIGHQSPKQRE